MKIKNKDKNDNGNKRGNKQNCHIQNLIKLCSKQINSNFFLRWKISLQTKRVSSFSNLPPTKNGSLLFG